MKTVEGMKWWIALVLAVVAFFLMEGGYAFLAVLAIIGIVLVAFSTQERRLAPVAYVPYPLEEEDEPIIYKQHPPKFPRVLRIRIRPKAKRRSSWEKAMAGVGDVMDTIFASGYRALTGKHEEKETEPWLAGRGR